MIIDLFLVGMFWVLTELCTCCWNWGFLSCKSYTLQSHGYHREGEFEAVGSPARPQDLRNGAEVTSNGNAHVELNKPDYDQKDTILDEEEAAFLRSLGWVEDSGEDEEGLTEEEINAFYQEVSISNPDLFLC